MFFHQNRRDLEFAFVSLMIFLREEREERKKESSGKLNKMALYFIISKCNMTFSGIE